MQCMWKWLRWKINLSPCTLRGSRRWMVVQFSILTDSIKNLFSSSKCAWARHQTDGITQYHTYPDKTKAQISTSYQIWIFNLYSGRKLNVQINTINKNYNHYTFTSLRIMTNILLIYVNILSHTRYAIIIR